MELHYDEVRARTVQVIMLMEQYASYQLISPQTHTCPNTLLLSSGNPVNVRKDPEQKFKSKAVYPSVFRILRL